MIFWHFYTNLIAIVNHTMQNNQPTFITYGKKWEWRAFLIALITSIIFWMLLALNKKYTYKLQYPIEIYHTLENIVELVPPPKFVTVSVTGKGWELLKKQNGYGLEKIKVQLNKPLKTSFLSTTDIFQQIDDKLHNNFNLNSILEDTIYFKYDLVKEKIIKLELDSSSLDLQSNVRLKDPIQIIPEFVKIRGAESIINTISSSSKIKSKQNKINSTTTLTIPLHFNEYKTVWQEFDFVKVTIHVNHFTKVVLPVKIHEINFPKLKNVVVKMENTPFFINAWVNDENLQKLSTDTLKADFDFLDINWHDSTIIPNIQVPHYLENIHFSPSKLKVRYESK